MADLSQMKLNNGTPINRKRKMIVSVVGDTVCSADSEKYILAMELGKALVDNGYRVMTGGNGGIMKAAHEGAHRSKKYREGDTIAILPQADHNEANAYADICIGSGLDMVRDLIVANSKVVIAVGGGSGTLHEMAAAWQRSRMIIGYTNVKGWSANLAGQKMDNRQRYGGVDDVIWPVTNAKEVIATINKYLPMYTKVTEKLAYDHRMVVEEAEPRTE
ncbi:MAG: acyl-CoA synthetase [Firmicutes bacterium]|nr:acyl-CoA synthetase [Bacillota bacterium]